MLRALKILISLLIFLVLIILMIINVRLYDASQIEVSGEDTVNLDLVKNLRGLRTSLRNGADEQMQGIYPEGYIFLNVLYGLAWCNLVEGLDPASAYALEGRAEIQQAWDRIDSPAGKSNFSKELPLPYGAFYTGWSTYLLGKKLQIENSAERNREEVRHFEEQCSRIASNLSSTLYPETYYGNSWPADVMLCVASLVQHDKIFPPRYTALVNQWVKYVEAKLDPNGLIPHAAQTDSGKPLISARGSSQSLMLIFLWEIDRDFGVQQFRLFQKKFLDCRLGLRGVREYPAGYEGQGDIDSGPVILSMGAAATIVGMQTCYLYGDAEAGLEIRGMIETLGLPWERNGEKTYLAGTLPMADAFIAWGHSRMKHETQSTPGFNIFHLYSAAIGLVFTFILWRLMTSLRR